MTRQALARIGPVLMRASTTAAGPGAGAVLPDATSATKGESARAHLDWLVAHWADPRTREVMTVAAPSFAAQVEAIISARSSLIGAREADRIRRAAVSLFAYLARWQRRATPFGLFAGVAIVHNGPAAASVFGDAHRAHVRADSTWLACVIDALEADPDLRGRLSVVFNNTAKIRDGRVHISSPTRGQFRGMNPAAPSGAMDAWGWRETSLRYNKLIEYVGRLTQAPVAMSQLLDHLDAALPTMARERLTTVLDHLLDAGALVTCLRPPTTTDDALRHLCTKLDRAGAASLAGVADTFKQLCEIHEDLTRYAAARDCPADATHARAYLQAAESAMARINGDRQPLAFDTELDASVRLPRPVLAEAKRAAETLLRLTTEPFGSPAWVEYHLRFRERYGPGAVVPVRDLVSDAGLGYPTGYLGSPSTTPIWRTVTDRDAYLAGRIQETTLAGRSELSLTDRDLEKLTVGDQATVTPPERIELGFVLVAETAHEVDAGNFQLQITATPASATSMMGRFAALLPDRGGHAVAATFDDEPSDPGRAVVHAQLSFPSRQASGGNVTRVGQLLPAVIHLGEHPASQADGPTGQELILLDELAVAGDAERLWLVHVSTGRVVVARVPHALELTTHAPVLARFIAEVSESRSAVFRPLDPGAAARSLPYLPRITHRRTVLAPARWRVSNSDFDTPSPDQRSDGWDAELHRWRDRWKVPARVVVCSGDLRLPIDLDNPSDQLLLRRQLGRTPEAILQEDLAPDGGWLGRPAEFLAAFAAQRSQAESSRRSQELTLQQPPATGHPGTNEVLVAHLPCNPDLADDLLVAVGSLLDQLVQKDQPRPDSSGYGTVLAWWARRDHDPLDPAPSHRISLFLKLSTPEAYGDVAAALGGIATELAARNLPHLFTLAPYTPHTPRYGGVEVFPLVEAVFAADTAAALTQIRFTHRVTDPSVGDPRAVAAASMASIAGALAPDQATGNRWLAECLRGHTAPVAHAVTTAARSIAAPDGSTHPLLDSVGVEVAEAWAARRTALANYRDALIATHARNLGSADPHDPARVVLHSLLHEHVRRTLGTDSDLERQANHAARSVALSLLAQGIRS